MHQAKDHLWVVLPSLLSEINLCVTFFFFWYAKGALKFMGAINSSDPMFPVPLEPQDSLKLDYDHPMSPYDKCTPCATRIHSRFETTACAREVHNWSWLALRIFLFCHFLPRVLSTNYYLASLHLGYHYWQVSARNEPRPHRDIMLLPLSQSEREAFGSPQGSLRVEEGCQRTRGGEVRTTSISIIL